MGDSSARLAEGGTEIGLGGPPYVDVLAGVHRRLRPRTYFEIGTRRGSSLRVASCASLAIDPTFQLEEGVVGSKPICILHQSTSDEFFASRDPIDILGSQIDLAFIDGLHILEYVLRDFIGTERSVNRGSMIVVDDCCPRDLFMARRTREAEDARPTKFEGFWTGDVWKLIPILRKYRPDLEVRTLDAQPTGLVICTNLDPENRTLAANYDGIVRQWTDVSLEDYGMARLLEDLRMESASSWLEQLTPLYPGDPAPPEAIAPTTTASDVLLEVLLADNELLLAELERMRGSNSWQITSPLRALRRRVRRS